LLQYSSANSKWEAYAFVLSDWWDYDYGDLINVPTLLSDFTDDLGNRGYNSLSNFTNDYSYYNSTTLQNLSQLSNDLNIGNWTLDKPNYYTISQIENNFTNYFNKSAYYSNATSTFIFQSSEGDLNVNSSNYWDGYNTPSEITSGNSELLDNYDSTFFLPLNTSLIGDFNFTGQFDYNGGWTSNGLSVIDGDLYAQNVYAYNFSGLDVTHLNTNGSLYPTMDNQFDLGNQTFRWRDLNLGRNAYIAGNVGIGTTSPQNKLNVVGDFNQSGSSYSFINNVYGEMFYYNSSGESISMNDTLQKFSFFKDVSHTNGFTKLSDNATLQLDIDGGVYRVIWKAEGTGVNNHLYEGYIFVNEEQQNNTYGRTYGTGNDAVEMEGFGYISLNQGDNVSLRLRDAGSTTSGTAYFRSLNIMRVGN